MRMNRRSIFTFFLNCSRRALQLWNRWARDSNRTIIDAQVWPLTTGYWCWKTLDLTKSVILTLAFRSLFLNLQMTAVYTVNPSCNGCKWYRCIVRYLCQWLQMETWVHNHITHNRKWRRSVRNSSIDKRDLEPVWSNFFKSLKSGNI